MKVVANRQTDELYVSFGWPHMDLQIDPRVQFEMPSAQELVRCKDLHPGAHMTMGTYHILYADAIKAIGKQNFASQLPWDTSLGERSTVKTVLAFTLKMNEQCLPSHTLKSRGSGSYMGDVCKCPPDFWQQPRTGWWGGIEVKVICMRDFCKDFVADVNNHANDPTKRREGEGLTPIMRNLPPCTFKSNIHYSIPAFQMAGCTLSALCGTIDQGRTQDTLPRWQSG